MSGSILETKVHTIFLMVGPSGCGKSTFSKKVLIPQLLGIDDYNVQYLSSDEIRCEVLGKEYWKHDDEMMFASQTAFDLLFKKLDCVTSYPINAEFVIVDTTGLAKEFRDDVLKVARKNNYNVEIVLFGYKNKDEFLKGLDDRYSKKVVFNQIKRLNQEVYKEISKKDYNAIHKIKEKYFEDYTVVVSNESLYRSCHLPEDNEYVIVGDIHGALSEFKELLVKNKFIIKDNQIVGVENDYPRKIVLVGDYLDKGKDISGLINFIYNNLEWFEIVYANHENFNYKWMKGLISKKSVDSKIVDDFFDSTKILEQDSQLTEKFFKIVDSSKPFLKSKYFIVTHAPCENNYLGKLDKASLKAQQNFRMRPRDEFKTFEEYKEYMEKDLSFLKDEAVRNHPYHVFGHRSFKDVLRLKNKLGIDTGADSGGKLTSVKIIDRFNKFFEEVKVASSRQDNKDLFNLFDRKYESDYTYDLSPRDLRRIDFAIEKKINFISGTMSPASKYEEEDDLESLFKALDYYKRSGVKEVILQTKYMGSRANVYLFKDIAKCYATSRNGHIINHDIDLKKSVFEPLLEKFKKEMESENIEMILLDGELMPWSALGKDLIDSQFGVVATGIKTEYNFLKENNFEEHLNNLKSSIDSTDFVKDEQTLAKKDLVDKYTHPVYSTFKGIRNYLSNHIPLERQKDYLDKYKEQLDIYGSDQPVHYKAFSILKFMYADGSEKLFFDETNEDIYKKVSDDDYLVLDITGDLLKGPLLKANFFFTHQTVNEKKEGVVVKPNDKVYIKGVAPFIKVRNPDYLRIIYGYDYLEKPKYAKLMRQKNVKNKLRTSLKEFEIGKSMLEIPYNEISKDNNNYKKCIIKMIGEEKIERELDPRL